MHRILAYVWNISICINRQIQRDKVEWQQLRIRGGRFVLFFKKNKMLNCEISICACIVCLLHIYHIYQNLAYIYTHVRKKKQHNKYCSDHREASQSIHTDLAAFPTMVNSAVSLEGSNNKVFSPKTCVGKVNLNMQHAVMPWSPYWRHKDPVSSHFS